MIKSRYVYNIVCLLIDGHVEEANLKKQVELLIDDEYNYTGAGLIVSFKHEKSIFEFRVKFEGILNGVKIIAPELDLGAQSSLFFEDGIISYLELFSNSGVYPEHILTKYKLSQEWQSDRGNEIIVN